MPKWSTAHCSGFSEVWCIALLVGWLWCVACSALFQSCESTCLWNHQTLVPWEEFSQSWRAQPTLLRMDGRFDEQKKVASFIHVLKIVSSKIPWVIGQLMWFSLDCIVSTNYRLIFRLQVYLICCFFCTTGELSCCGCIASLLFPYSDHWVDDFLSFPGLFSVWERKHATLSRGIDREHLLCDNWRTYFDTERCKCTSYPKQIFR